MTLNKSYDHKKNSNKLYEMWEEGGFFEADSQSPKPSFTVVMPPPNVTGVLHMGHALGDTLQDVMIRWKRMSGFEALWVPGVDHAGISTQTVVERHLIATTGKRRKEFSREEFLDHVWEWKGEKERSIIDQMKAMGCSCAWSRYRFTMDDKSNRAVRTMFKKLFDDGLIYQGDYLVNWDPATQTAIADDEVEYVDKSGFIWTIRYPLTDGSGHLSIATTRPETMLGDTAVAVHPDDERYTKLVGSSVTLPLVNREIPIIADRMVDPKFGTGVVKITPAHDPNDYLVGTTHSLPMINIMTPDGRLNEEATDFAGLTMEEGRKAVLNRLKAEGFLLKQEPHTNRIGLSYRSKVPVEPYISKQWFIRMDEFARKLRQAVDNEKVKLIPKNWENTYFHWIDNLRDWCISRQLWWGHRIPVWHRKDDPDVKICYDGEGLPPEVEKEPDVWEQDPDALDTWFSSALWPFSALGWPDSSDDVEKFYPNAVLMTGYDILFFWVARMILMGEYALGEVPFPHVFLSGLIYGRSYWRKDEEGGVHYISGQERIDYDLGKALPKDVQSKWEKLSKSKGNVIDPLELIEEYGIDAVRMGLCAGNPQNSQIDLDRRRFEEFRNFTNKIWNGARFVLMNLEDLTQEQFAQGIDSKLLQLEDRWILSVLNKTVKKVNRALDAYAFDQAAMSAYDFFWNEFCAYYVEASKPALFGKVGDEAIRKNKQKVLLVVLVQAIRLLHPIAPYITEELFGKIKELFASPPAGDLYTYEALEALATPACIVAPYPTELGKSDEEAIELFDKVCRLIYTVRNMRGELKVPAAQGTDVYIINGSHLQSYTYLIPPLVKTKEIFFVEEEPDLPFVATGVIGEIKVVVPLPQELREQELTRLAKEKEKLIEQIGKLEGQLNNAAFVDRAPKQLVEKTRAQLEDAQKELSEVETTLGQRPAE